jgi:MFS family permease
MAATPMLTAREEWRSYPLLPIAAAVGYATSVIHVYGFGPYIEPISREFGWTRTQITIGMTIATLLQSLFSIPIGMLVDRMGSRRLGVLGLLTMPGAFALVGTATGSEANWYLIWALISIGVLPVQSTIWSSAVASRFTASRGLALAIALCGSSVAAAVLPWLATELIGAYGWRQAIFYYSAIWAAIGFPIVALFFRGARDGGAKEAAPAYVNVPGMGLLEGLKSTVFLRLLLASVLITFAVIALLFHFIPILTGAGMDKLQAAGCAALIGLFSIAGRLITGVLLDRFRGSLVGAVAFLMPAIGCLLLIASAGTGPAPYVAASLIGLALGAEIDVIVYLTTQYFGLRNFGALYGGLLMALSLGTAIGPLAASRVFDLYGSYAPFLWLIVGAMIGSSLALASLPRPPAGTADH